MNSQRKKVKRTNVTTTKAQINELVNVYGKLIKKLCEGDIKNDEGKSPMMENPINYSFFVGQADMLRSILTTIYGIERKELDELEERIREETTKNG